MVSEICKWKALKSFVWLSISAAKAWRAHTKVNLHQQNRQEVNIRWQMRWQFQLRGVSRMSRPDWSSGSKGRLISFGKFYQSTQWHAFTRWWKCGALFDDLKLSRSVTYSEPISHKAWARFNIVFFFLFLFLKPDGDSLSRLSVQEFDLTKIKERCSDPSPRAKELTPRHGRAKACKGRNKLKCQIWRICREICRPLWDYHEHRLLILRDCLDYLSRSKKEVTAERSGKRKAVFSKFHRHTSSDLFFWKCTGATGNIVAPTK